MKTDKPYLYLSGLMDLAADVRGDEVVHVGIRPYGYHAGNDVALVVYPYLLCKYVESLGKKAAFTFYYSINDMEQDALDGPDIRRYPFNIYPHRTSLQYTYADGVSIPTTDFWQLTIEERVVQLTKSHPGISIDLFPNNTTRYTPPPRFVIRRY